VASPDRPDKLAAYLLSNERQTERKQTIKRLIQGETIKGMQAIQEHSEAPSEMSLISVKSSVKLSIQAQKSEFSDEGNLTDLISVMNQYANAANESMSSNVIGRSLFANQSCQHEEEKLDTAFDQALLDEPSFAPSDSFFQHESERELSTKLKSGLEVVSAIPMEQESAFLQEFSLTMQNSALDKACFPDESKEPAEKLLTRGELDLELQREFGLILQSTCN